MVKSEIRNNFGVYTKDASDLYKEATLLIEKTMIKYKDKISYDSMQTIITNALWAVMVMETAIESCDNRENER